MPPDLILQHLFDLKYVDEFYDKLKNHYKVYFSIQVEVEERYRNSRRQLLSYLRSNQESEPTREIIDHISQILDPKNEINNQTKVVLMWHRFSRFDLFQALEFSGWELNVVIQNFSNHLRTKYIKDVGRYILLHRAWEIMMNLSLKPSILLLPLEEIPEASDEISQQGSTAMKKKSSSVKAIGSSNLTESTYVSNITTNPDLKGSTTDVKQNTKSSEAYINSHQRKNRLNEYLGLFIPIISDLRLPKTPFFLNLERYELLQLNVVHKRLRIKLENELERSNVNLFQTNVIERIENLLFVQFNFEILDEESTTLGINESKFSIKPDKVIKIGKSRIIPIEIKSNLREVYTRFMNSTINSLHLEKEMIPFCMIYSQVFRECISCNSVAAFVSDGSFTLFIKIVPSANFNDNWTSYGPNIYKFLNCKIFVVNTNMQLINCILDAARDSGTEATKNELEKLVAKFYNEKPQIDIICENFYQRFQLLLEELEFFLSKRIFQEHNVKVVRKDEVDTENIIDGDHEADETTISAATEETGTTIRTINGASTVSQKSEPDDRGITVDEVFRERYIEILKIIKHSYNSSFEIKHLEEILKDYKILDVLGGKSRFGNNAVVLEIQSRRTDEQLILKIYDPLYSTALIRKKYQLNSAIRDVTRSFIRECCSYYLLKKKNFQHIPKVYTVGILKSNDNFMMKSLHAECKQVNLKGYFIIMEKLTLSKSLTAMGKPKRVQYKEEIYRLSDLMHSYRISHGDIFSGNILVQESGAVPRIVFIDFGSSKVSRDRKDSPFLKAATGKDRFELSVARDNYKLKHLFSNGEPGEAEQEAKPGRKRLLITTGDEVPKSNKRKR